MRLLGIDVGSVTVKLALLGPDGRTLGSVYRRHHGRPLPALAEALGELAGRAGPGGPLAAAVTGSGREAAGCLLGVPAVNEIVAQAVAAAERCPQARTIIEIGGQDSKFIRLGPPRGRGAPAIIEHRMNDVCAAGTGAFLERQAERLGMDLESFGPRALEGRDPAFVAGRCAVYSKTDVTHLIQEGRDPADIAAGICRAVARNYLAQFSPGARVEAPALFLGGVAANAGVVRAFRDLLGLPEEGLIVPPEFRVMVALGAALLARDERGEPCPSLDALIAKLAGSAAAGFGAGRAGPSSLARLERRARTRPELPVSPPEEHQAAFMGIDVGSTSTCVALLDGERRLVAESYTLNRGNVIESVGAALGEVRAALARAGREVLVRGVGVTGSGRQVTARYVGADVVRDEISAQARAAVHLLPDVDTVFEIGGQDGKYLRIAGGRVADFEMNRICSAGTGAFLQEQAVRLGLDVRDLGAEALRAARPADLGSRCTVFMESDLVHYQQAGVPRPDLVAGLSYSIARNYLEKVVAARPVGRRVLFLGGVAFNESVAAALEQLLGRELVIPAHHATSGAIGMALIAGDAPPGASRFRGFGVRAEGFAVRSFQCGDCSNACRISQVTTDGAVERYGGVCGKHEGAPRKASTLPDLFKERQALLWSCWRGPGGGGQERIGIARALLFYEQFPLWCAFLQELGFEVVVSDPTDGEILRGGLERALAENCFPAKVVAGHLQNLVGKGIRRVFLPMVVETGRRVRDLERNYACPRVQALPALFRGAFPLELISPVFTREAGEDEWRQALAGAGRRLGRPAAVVRRAVERAAEAQAEFSVRCEALGARLLGERKGVRTLLPERPFGCSAQKGPDPFSLPLIAVLGKSYNVCDPQLNLNLAGKLAAAGALPIPYDCLPLSAERLSGDYADLVWNSGQDLVRAALLVERRPELHALLVTSFGCGPDSFTAKYLAEILRDRSFLTVEVDEHTSEVGLVTRIEAFTRNLRAPAGPAAAAPRARFAPYRAARCPRNDGRIVYLPGPFAHFRVMAAALESAGIRAKVLPPPDEETERLGRRHSSGRECLPYIMYLGDAVKMTRDPEFDPDRAAFFIPGSNLACRISAYPTSIRLVLSELGCPQVPVIAPRVSMDTDEMLEAFGMGFARRVYSGILAAEALGKRLAETRPYERDPGASDRAHERGVERLCRALLRGGLRAALGESLREFGAVPVEAPGSRPVIGLLGDEYTRSTEYANQGIVRQIEALGGEVWIAPVWGNYLEFQRVTKPRKMLRRGRWGEFLLDEAKSLVQRFEAGRVRALLDGSIRYPDPGYAEMMSYVAGHLEAESEPLTIIGLAHALHLMRRGADGIVNPGAFQCMINSVVAAKLRAAAADFGDLPVLTLNFDFQKGTHLRNRLDAFMYQARQFRLRRAELAAAGGHPAPPAGS